MHQGHWWIISPESLPVILLLELQRYARPQQRSEHIFIGHHPCHIVRDRLCSEQISFEGPCFQKFSDLKQGFLVLDPLENMISS